MTNVSIYTGTTLTIKRATFGTNTSLVHSHEGHSRKGSTTREIS